MEPAAIALSTRYLLFCEGRTKKAGLTGGRFTVNASPAKVSTSKLGIDLMTIAVYNLYRSGYISLEVVKRSTLLIFKDNLLMIKALKSYPTQLSVEAQLMQHITNANKQVTQVIDEYFGQPVSTPEKNIVLNAVTDATNYHLGFADESSKARSEDLHFNVGDGKIEYLEELTRKDLKAWDDFNATEPKLAEMLKSKISSAIILNTTKQEYT